MVFQREASSLETFLSRQGKNVLQTLNCQQQQKERIKQSIRNVRQGGIKPKNILKAW